MVVTVQREKPPNNLVRQTKGKLQPSLYGQNRIKLNRSNGATKKKSMVVLGGSRLSRHGLVTAGAAIVVRLAA